MRSDPNREAARVAAFYNDHPETNRLRASVGKLEFERSKRIIGRHLKPSLRVLDLGGGTGIYSFWLASLGHRVTLADLSAVHVRTVAEQNSGASCRLEQIVQASALALPFADRQFDAVLNMGPLYHLSPTQRPVALGEIRRVLHPEGVMVSAYISRFASLMDGYNEGYVKDPAYLPLAIGAAVEGRHDPPEDGRYFTLAYMHRPEEVEPELSAAGFTMIELCAVEGFFWAHPRVEDYIASESDLKDLLATVELLEKEPSIMGASAHFLAVSKPAADGGAA